MASLTKNSNGTGAFDTKQKESVNPIPNAIHQYINTYRRGEKFDQRRDERGKYRESELLAVVEADDVNQGAKRKMTATIRRCKGHSSLS